MSNMNNTYFGKTSKFNNKSKTQNIAAGLRNEVIDPDVFYTRCNENISSKKKIQELELENKRLSAKSQHLLVENKKLNMKLNKDPQYIKEENSKQEYSIDNQTMKGQKGYIAWKIDLVKAYDKLQWSFISKVIKEVGFDGKFAELIMWCISSV